MQLYRWLACFVVTRNRFYSHFLARCTGICFLLVGISHSEGVTILWTWEILPGCLSFLSIVCQPRLHYRLLVTAAFPYLLPPSCQSAPRGRQSAADVVCDSAEWVCVLHSYKSALLWQPVLSLWATDFSGQDEGERLFFFFELQIQRSHSLRNLNSQTSGFG